MGSRILVSNRSIRRLRNHRVAANDHGANRNIASRGSIRCRGERFVHPPFVVQLVGQRDATAGSSCAALAFVNTISPSGPSAATIASPSWNRPASSADDSGFWIMR